MLSTVEKKNKDYIATGFKLHKGEWLETANRLLDAFGGKYFSFRSTKSRFTVNTMFNLVNLFLPNFVFKTPYVRVRPQQGKYFKKLADGEYQQIDTGKASIIREASINHLYNRTLDGITENRKAIQDALFFGFGVTKVGYSFETVTTKDTDYIVKDTPFLKRVNPKDFAWHPLATGMDDSPFFVHRIVTTKEALKKQGKYSKAAIDKIPDEIPKYLKEKMDRKSSKMDLKGFITIYEVHDMDGEMIYTFGGEKKELLGKIENPYDFLGSHFSMIKFSSDNDEFVGIPMLAMIEDD